MKSPVKIGWREWVSLPELGIDRIKAKIDSGARTSSLHVEDLELFDRDGQDFARFEVIYGSRARPKRKACVARVVEHRNVTDSGGHVHERTVITTEVRIGDESREAELTLARREGMKFRMLLGRTTINQGFLVDPARSYLASKRRLTPHKISGK